MNKKGRDLLSALPPEMRKEAGRSAAKDAKEGTTHFYDEFLDKSLNQDREEAGRKNLQVGNENAVEATTPEQRRAAGQRRPMTAEEKRNAGREAARAAIAADPSILEDPDDPFEGSERSGAVSFSSTKPDKNGMTPQQRKALGKQDARAELDTAQR